MKFFKKLFLLVPLLFAVASCSGPKSPAGTYSFQLGSDKGTHAGIHLLLTEDAVEVEDQEDAKRFELTFDLGASAIVIRFRLLQLVELPVQLFDLDA